MHPCRPRKCSERGATCDMALLVMALSASPDFGAAGQECDVSWLFDAAGEPQVLGEGASGQASASLILEITTWVACSNE